MTAIPITVEELFRLGVWSAKEKERLMQEVTRTILMKQIIEKSETLSIMLSSQEPRKWWRFWR